MMNEENKSRVKEIMLDVFRKFIYFCEEHQLNYFCCGGTAIGAVRHGGMIPWDDDIDILMPRPDYDQFLKLFPEKHQGCELVFAERTYSYYLPFAKLIAANTSLVEYRDIPCVLGVSIDIFPLDGIASNSARQVELMKQFRRIANKLLVIPKRPLSNLKASIKHLFKGQLRTAMNESIYAIGKKRSRTKILKQLSDLMRKYSYASAPYVANYGGMWGVREISRREWFDGYCEMEFEGMKVRLPKNYDAYLKGVYGDYMVPPPVEKRVSHHNFAYLNLDERKDICTIKLGGGHE